jgi:hypothetical protein
MHEHEGLMKRRQAVTNQKSNWIRMLNSVAAFLIAGYWVASGASALARDRVEVEGESFHNSWNQGGLPIRVSTCFNASAGHVADGLDVSGEWIDLEITLPWTRCYEDWIGFQGDLGQTSSVRMIVYDSGQHEPLLTSDFIFNGEGVD